LIKDAPALRKPDEVLDMLQSVSLKHPQRLKVASAWDLRPYSAARGYEGQPGRDIFFHPEFDTELYAEYKKRRDQGGYFPLTDYIRNISGPVTMTETMRALRLTGDARWIFDLYQEFGVRDYLLCTFRHWSVQFVAEKPLRLERGDRFYLAMAASAAVERMDQFVRVRRQQTANTTELSDREKLVLRLLAEGLTADEIAGQLYIASGSVRTYIRRMLEKLGARNSIHAVSIAWRIGLFDD
jgi:DNA-binding CsgD family transcriptional regulator